MPIFGKMRSMLAVATTVAMPAVAFAQAGLLQGQTQATTGAIESQIHEAVKPQMQISNSAGAITGLALSADGSLLAIAPSDHTIRVWNLQNGVQQARLAAPAAMSPAAFAEAGLGGNAQIAAERPAGDRLTVVDPRGGATLVDTPVAQGSARFVVVDSQHRRIFTGGNDGIVRMRDLASGKLLVQIISTLTGWAAVDGQGRFDGPLAGIDDIKWLASQLQLPIDNFSAPYFEPGLVARYFREPSGFVAVAPAPVFGGIALPPKVTVTAQPGQGSTAEVTVTAIDQGAGVGAASLFQNGKLVPADRRGGPSQATQNGAKTTIWSYSVPLAPGANRFEAVVSGSNNIEGEHATTELAGAGGAPVTATGAAAALPTLRILAVGINKYRDSRLDLDYGVADADSILGQFSESQGTFGRVASTRLVDAGATRAAIVGALTQLQSAPAGDVLVVYLAGHGEIQDGDWYFLPHDFVFSREGIKRTGISATALRDMLSRVGPQRVLVLIDSCKSGGSIDTLATAIDRKLLRSLGRDAGVAILAGARRDQNAEEFPQLHHGAFTYVVLQGVGGKADARHNGSITSDEVLTYSASSLPELTQQLIHQMQVPVSYSRGENFLVHHAGQ
ncbi:MAG TPA: caspase family protein [Stellaceae bacterium]|jgi:hypothetical protein